MFVLGHHHIALAARDRHRDDLAGKPAARLRGRGALLRAQRKGILVGACNAEVGGDVLRGFGHRVDAELPLQRRVDEAPSHRGVVDRIAARKRGVRLRHHERRARHALDAAGHHQLGLAGADGARADAHRIQAGAAQAIDGRRRHALRQAGEQRGHARDVAVVLAGLVGAAVVDVVERSPVDAGMARHQRPERHRGQVVGPHAGQCTAIAADRRADAVTQEDFVHWATLRAARSGMSTSERPLALMHSLSGSMPRGSARAGQAVRRAAAAARARGHR